MSNALTLPCAGRLHALSLAGMQASGIRVGPGNHRMVALVQCRCSSRAGHELARHAIRLYATSRAYTAGAFHL